MQDNGKGADEDHHEDGDENNIEVRGEAARVRNREIDAHSGAALQVGSLDTSSDQPVKMKKKQKKLYPALVEADHSQPPVYDQISIGSERVLEIEPFTDSNPAVNILKSDHSRSGSHKSAKKYSNMDSSSRDEELDVVEGDLPPKNTRKESTISVAGSSRKSRKAVQVEEAEMNEPGSQSRPRGKSKSVQISSHSLQLNSDGTSEPIQTKVEVPVVIHDEIVKPHHSRRISNFDMFSPSNQLPVVILDMMTDAADNDRPPPGFENRNMRLSSQQLPQVPLLTIQNSELALVPNLIMKPLDTAHRLQIVDQSRSSNHHPRRSSAHLVQDDEFESPIRAHSVAEGKKVQKKVKRKRKSVSTKPRRFNNCTSACWWIFTTFLVFLISCLAMQLGRIGKLVYPFDSSSNQCGIDRFSTMPSLYYFNVTSVGSYKRCVEKCPKSTAPVCKYNVSFAWADYNLRKKQLSGKICIWSKGAYADAFYRCVSLDVSNTNYLSAQQVAATEALTDDLQSQSIMTSFFNILINCIIVLAACALGSVIASALWYFLLLSIGPALLYFSVTLILISLWGGTGYMAYQYYRLKTLSSSLTSAIVTQLDSTLIYNPSVILGGLIFLALCAIGFTGAIISARNSVRLAGKIMTEAGNHLMNIYLVPLLMATQACFAILLSGFAILVVGLLYTVSPNETLGSGFASLTKSLIQPVLINVYMTIFCFWFVWTLLINYAFGRAAVAKSIGNVYWSGTGVSKGKIWVGRSALDILHHHFGTLAFGVIAIPSVFILNIIEYSIRPSFQKVRNIVEEENIAAPVTFIDKMRAWIKHVLHDINHKAFIQIALGGGDLCSASRVASDVFQKELSSVIKMGKAISWICVLSIAVGMSVVALILTNTTTTASSLSSALPIIIVILLCSLYVAAIFIQSFAISIDTILYCYCEDLEMNDGSAMMPYAMPDTLKLFIADLNLKSIQGEEL